MKRWLKRQYMKFKYRKAHMLLASGSDIGISSVFEGHDILYKNSSFTGSMGYGSYIAADCIINADIGRYTSIAGGVRVVGGSHPTKDFVSMSPAFYTPNPDAGLSYVKTLKYKEHKGRFESGVWAKIGNDVWIG